MSPVRAPRWRGVRLLLVVALGLTALSWSAAPGAGAQSCGPAPQGRVAVSVVVDDGAATPSARCVEVPERSTGYDVLVAAGHTLRIESGFLCAIDGVPATGCGNRPDFGGAYWRYFHAAPGGDWSYSSVGGGGYRMPARCAIEGWRFATSSNEQVAPRIAPPSITCEAPPVTAPPATSPPATSPPASVAPPAGGDGGVVVPPVDGAAPGATTSAPTSTVTAGEADGGAEGSSTASTSEASVAGSEAERAGAADSSDTDTPDGSEDAGSSGSSGGSSAVGLVLGLVLVAAVGGAAWWRARARRVGSSDQVSQGIEGPEGLAEPVPQEVSEERSTEGP